MKKIALLISLSLAIVSCKKNEQLPELASDNDYKNLELKGRVCEISQKIKLLNKTNHQIEDTSITYFFSPEGYLINDSIYTFENNLAEVNTYKKQDFPLTKKQFIDPNNYFVTNITYDSLGNLKHFKKTTHEKKVIEEQIIAALDKNKTRETYFSAGNAVPYKTIEIETENDKLKKKSIFSEHQALQTKVIYEYENNQISKEIYLDKQNKITSSIVYKYNGANKSQITNLNAEGKEESVEEYKYNKNNEITYKSVYTPFDQTKFVEIFEYTPQNKISKIETKINDKLIINTSYQYDKYNNVTKMVMENFESNEKLTKTYSYKYDEKGNWINKQVSINETPIYQVNRSIKYCN